MSHPYELVTLTSAEMRLATYLAKQRYATCRKVGLSNKRGAPKGIDVEYIGAAGEIAFCKYANIYPDMTLNIRKGGEDCHLNGTTIDVKTTSKHGSPLVVDMWKTVNDADVYVLVEQRDKETYIIIGQYQAELLFMPENVKDVGYGDRYIIERSKLEAV